MRILYLFVLIHGLVLCLECPFGDFNFPHLDYSVVFQTAAADEISCNCMKAIYRGGGVTRYESLMEAKGFHSLIDWEHYQSYHTFFRNIFPMNSKIWLGITCADNNAMNCVVDNGQPIPETLLTDFATGHPNISIGPYVYVSTLNGTATLYSSSNKAAINGYVMRYSPDNTHCPAGFSGYKNLCYYAAPREADFKSARKHCNSLGPGVELATIPAKDYNSIVKNMEIHTFFIGFQQKALSWLDGSPITYENFGFVDTNLGNCVVVSRDTLSDTGNIMPGEWTYARCSDSFHYACSVGRKGRNSLIVTKDVCIEPIYISVKESGKIFSNQTNLMNTCTYVLTAPPKYQIEAVAEFTGDSSDMNHIIRLTLYNDATSYTEYLQYNSRTHPIGSFISKTNSMRIVFDTNGRQYNYKWKVSYKLKN